VLQKKTHSVLIFTLTAGPLSFCGELLEAFAALQSDRNKLVARPFLSEICGDQLRNCRFWFRILGPRHHHSNQGAPCIRLQW
jgi:hypothetical protein